jgi:hypothetical protein
MRIAVQSVYRLRGSRPGVLSSQISSGEAHKMPVLIVPFISSQLSETF